MLIRRFTAVAVLLAAPIAVSAQNAEVSPDQVFATVGRCTVEVDYLRKALVEAKAKIAELTKVPAKGDTDGK